MSLTYWQQKHVVSSKMAPLIDICYVLSLTPHILNKQEAFKEDQKLLGPFLTWGIEHLRTKELSQRPKGLANKQTQRMI